MKFEASKLSKVIEQNYTNLMPDFFEMQTEYLASLNIIYHDLDASLVAMVITSQLYKSKIEKGKTEEHVSLKDFYKKENFNIPASSFKIKDISLILNLPRETVRRKKEKIIKDKLIMLDKKRKLYTLNTDMIEEKILKLQIENLSKFLSKFYFFFTKNKFFAKEVTRDEIKNDLEKKFLLYLTKFLDFQISYFSRMKAFIDIESIFILLLCNLNTTAQMKSQKENVNSNFFFTKLHTVNNTHGLNASSISEITKVPRTTVIRKINKLLKYGMIRKDSNKRYISDNLTKMNDSKKIISIMDSNIKELGIFFSQCLETYSTKH